MLFAGEEKVDITWAPFYKSDYWLFTVSFPEKGEMISKVLFWIESEYASAVI